MTTASASNAIAVTPNDDTDLTHVTRELYIGGAGDLEVIMEGGNTVIFPGVPAGARLALRVSRVKDANTTATNIVAIW
jgi:hypothetical protein